MSRMLSTAEAIELYGTPNQSGTYLVSISLPFPMRLAWDKNVKTKTVRVHKKVAGSLLAILNEVLSVYGYDKIVELGIDLFGGSFAYRAMRGGNKWSKHAFGIAIDLDPERNQLKETSKTARFARPEYKALIDIFYKYGWVNLGREKNYDFMHFEKGA